MADKMAVVKPLNTEVLVLVLDRCWSRYHPPCRVQSRPVEATYLV